MPGRLAFLGMAVRLVPLLASHLPITSTGDDSILIGGSRVISRRRRGLSCGGRGCDVLDLLSRRLEDRFFNDEPHHCHVLGTCLGRDLRGYG